MYKNKKEILSIVLMGLCSIIHLGCAYYTPTLAVLSGGLVILSLINHLNTLGKGVKWWNFTQ